MPYGGLDDGLHAPRLERLKYIATVGLDEGPARRTGENGIDGAHAMMAFRAITRAQIHESDFGPKKRRESTTRAV